MAKACSVECRQFLEERKELERECKRLRRRNFALERENERLIREKQKILLEFEELRRSSRMDTLTALQNRDAYEMDFPEAIWEICQRSLGLILIDADALKYVNDTKGHQEGDKMLIFIANKIKKYFGEDLSYRVGGDEFIMFVPDPEDHQISTELIRMIDEIEKGGCHVSFGWKIHDLDKPYDKRSGNTMKNSMRKLLKEAEDWMYSRKKKFHENHPEYDLRRGSENKKD